MRETERQKKIGDRENERPQKLSSPRTGKKKNRGNFLLLHQETTAINNLKTNA